MTRLINLEGIDCCGKTTLSKMLASRLSADHKTFFQATHEPHFSSADADKLNTPGIDPWQREYFFLKDRITHQDILYREHTILDRYILTGLAYTQTYSPEVVPMMKSVYRMPSEFKQPDLIVLIDIEPEDALNFNELKKGMIDYDANMTLNKLQTLRANFTLHLETMREWEIPFAVVKPVIGDIQATMEAILSHTVHYI